MFVQYFNVMLKYRIGTQYQQVHKKKTQIKTLVQTLKQELQMRAYFAGHNLFIDLDGLVCKKRGVASSHLIDENSKCPPVHSLVVALE